MAQRHPRYSTFCCAEGKLPVMKAAQVRIRTDLGSFKQVPMVHQMQSKPVHNSTIQRFLICSGLLCSGLFYSGRSVLFYSVLACSSLFFSVLKNQKKMWSRIKQDLLRRFLHAAHIKLKKYVK